MKPTSGEIARARAWIDRHIKGDAAPFSFLYRGRPSSQLIGGWKVARSSQELDKNRVETTVTCTDPQTGLEVRCVAIEYRDFPAVEWVLHFKNGGKAPSSMIEHIQALDVALALAGSGPCRVHHARGSDCKIDDFEPLETALPPLTDLRLASHLGRSSNRVLPFFNVETGDGGVIGSIAWTGGWAATFQRDNGSVHVRAGMEDTHLRLQPGEEIRSPGILLLFWDEDLFHGHNLLRRFIFAHHTPRPDGELLKAPICYGVWGKLPEAEQIGKARWWKQNNVPMEYLWVDAGWYGDAPYPADPEKSGRDWASQVGNWWPNKNTHPNGLGPVGQAAKDEGLGFVLWIEPERAFRGSAFTKEHPEWLFGPIGDNFLFNLGNPEGRKAITDLVSSILTEGKVTLYRQDFNTNPAPFWKAADAPDRVGMSEIRHIEGLYAMWDELLERHPGLIIDNCSSGGRRIDLEMMSRSIPLWRSDYQCFPMDVAGMQGQTFGLAPWVPLSTGTCRDTNDYAFRSGMGPGIVVNCNPYTNGPVEGFPVDWLRRSLNQELMVRKYFYGDFYPLTRYSLSHHDWLAWQFDLPEGGEGLVQAFRRPECADSSQRLRLHGFDAEAQYVVTDLDSGESQELSGATLMKDGLLMTVAEAPGCSIATYRRL